jgi:ribosomal protein S18 acetylase RimI-like enzyme
LSNKGEEPKFVFEPLGQKHDRAAFSCGVEALDTYLQKQASQDARKRAAVPFVLTCDGKTIAGYYTLSQYAIDLGDVPEEVAKRLPKYPAVSATLLGRLAVSTAFRGRGLGEKLLMDALYRSLKLSEQAASTGVVVDAKDEAARSFYRKYGFIEFPKIDKRLFLPMGTIEKLFAGQQVAKAL